MVPNVLGQKSYCQVTVFDRGVRWRRGELVGLGMDEKKKYPIRKRLSPGNVADKQDGPREKEV